MADDNTSQNDLNAQMQQGAEYLRRHANTAIDMYFSFLRQSVAAVPSGGTDFGGKVKSYAEKNVSAMHQFMTQLGRAKDLPEAMRLQKQFLETQMREWSGYAQGWAELFSKSAGEATKGPRPEKPQPQ